MKFGRKPEAAPPAEPAPSETYRVAVAHTDPQHPCATTSHWGPAYNASFADTAARVLGTPVESFDLLDAAARGAAQARDEYRGLDGWDVWVERLNPDGSWERV